MIVHPPIPLLPLPRLLQIARFAPIFSVIKDMLACGRTKEKTETRRTVVHLYQAVFFYKSYGFMAKLDVSET